MYDDLIKQLQDYAAGTMRDDDAEIAFDAINAIEKLEHKVFILEGDREGLLAQIPRWIPVSERLPETGVDVLVKFPQNMAVASIDIGEWVVNSGDGWCTDINLAGGEKNPTHWMPLPQPPKEGA